MHTCCNCLTLCMLGNTFPSFCCLLLTFSKIKIFQHYQRVKRFGSKSGSKPFANVISRRRKSLARKTLTSYKALPFPILYHSNQMNTSMHCVLIQQNRSYKITLLLVPILAIDFLLINGTFSAANVYIFNQF